MKPHIICHIASSVDGRLLNHRWSLPYDGSTQGEVLAQYATAGMKLGTDAWMFGLTTAKAFLPEKFQVTEAKHSEIRNAFQGNKSSKRWFIVSDPKGEIRYTRSEVRGDNIIAILGTSVSDEYLSHLRENNISYVFAGKDGFDLKAALETLYSIFGITSISLQGGGIINGAFLNEGLIDELSLIIYPGIDGLSGIPSIFEYLGQPDDMPAKGQSLQLEPVRQLDKGVVWLRYKFHHA